MGYDWKQPSGSYGYPSERRDGGHGHKRRFEYDRPSLPAPGDYGQPASYSGGYDLATQDQARGRSKFRVPRQQLKPRWGEPETGYSSSLSAIPRHLAGTLTMEQQEALAIRIRIEEITKKLNLNELDLDYHVERSPSPEPIYDEKGKRANTRDHRARDKLNLERQYLVELAMTLNPNFKPPADYTPVNSKKMKKIYIPIDRFPDYNFIGLIIGPRGNTQKRMERETNCKIAIRGKGSIKEGKGRKDMLGNGEDDKLHVLITAENEVQLEKASKMIQDLLVPVEEGKNEHKRQQLRELAEINGTLRDRMWMVSEGQSWERVAVKCAICGESSHPTSDCSLKGNNAALPAEQQKVMEDEYEKFLSEVGDITDNPESSYNEFLAALGGGEPALPWQQQSQATASWSMPSQVPVPWADPSAAAAAAAAAPPPPPAPGMPPQQGYGTAPWQQQQPAQ